MSNQGNLILGAHNIKKAYSGIPVLEFDHLAIYEGDRIGVVGDNGAGKTTLLSILMGEISPDQGHVTRHLQTAYLRQFEDYDETLSGGENRKRDIAREMGGDGQIIIADEPTANLDQQGVAWVERRLNSAAAIVLVSHDRALLDRLCTEIIEVADGKLTHFTGNYSDYEQAKKLEREQALDARSQRDRKERQLKQAIRHKEQTVVRSGQNYKRERLNNSSEAILGKMRLQGKMAQVHQERKALETRLDKLEDAPFIEKTYTMELDFSRTDPPGNPRVITCNNLSFRYGSNQVLDNVSFIIERGERVAITGENGAGKTTLLNQIIQRNPAVHVVPKLKIGYLQQNFEQLDEEETVLENVMSTTVQTEEVVRNTLASLLFFGNDVFKQAKVLSGGEKIKLALAKLVLSDINALFLDEPTNFLDLSSLEALENTLLSYPGTIVFVSHDKRFRETVATRELELSDGKLVDQSTAVKNPVDTDRMLLDMRRTELSSRLSMASGAEKDKLEQEYQQVIGKLQRLNRS